MRSFKPWPAALALALAAACSKAPEHHPVGITPELHSWFPIATGAVHQLGATHPTGTFECSSCHPATAASFKEPDCLSCHAHEREITDRLHAQTGGYAYESQACYGCHPASNHLPFDHAGITGQCAQCHDVGAVFAALPVAGFTHPAMNGGDCGACHDTTDWKHATGGPTDAVSDPARDLVVHSLLPTYSGFDISLLTPLDATLKMTMNHASVDVPAGGSSACANCHVGAASGAFFPGTLHSALANLTLPQPASCASCHAAAMPRGFVGPTATQPARTPPSPEMKHDAVGWAAAVPGITRLVPDDCGICHTAPGQAGAVASLSWSQAKYHPSLSARGLPQPASCVDCHANTRPQGVLTSANSSLAPGLTFDHGSGEAVGDCASCHARSATPPFTSWATGAFHTPGSTTPTTCLPCHAAARPTSTTGWLSTTYSRSPFDYANNHGAGLDCVTCHANPGTGQWGMGQNWASGNFTHGPGTLSATTCVSCHATQRPDLVLGVAAAKTALTGFDHSLDGTGDCAACHQATVTAGRYVDYFNASSTLPGGDWKNGVPYPGSTLAASSTSSITLSTLKLNRSGPNNLVTSATQTQATLYNAMLHVSAQLPAALNAGPTGMPDNSKCWHCHTSTGTTVTQYSGGRFHASLTNYRATPAAAVTPFPQPTQGCFDCHSTGVPANVVRKAGSNLAAMDHAARFAAPAVLGGKTVSSAAEADCSVCHTQPGNAWSDGAYHSRIGTAQPAECVSCHWVLLADAPKADLAQPPQFSMKHRSATLTTQSCETCHAGALARATQQPQAAALWATGALHPSLTTQPAACVDCHAASQPQVATQSSVTWSFTSGGGTATNAAMWMSHSSQFVAGKDCVVCHASDARKSGSAWNKADPFHAPSPGATTCAHCHGLANGGGSVAGTNNNLPLGLTDSHTVTTASASTGVAGARDRISHQDANVAGRECVTCHQPTAGAWSTWSSAKFHPAFGASNPLVLNGTTGRCSNCHLNLKPGAGYAAQDHSTFTAAPLSQDCSSCHSATGTGSANAPNWLGATGSPSTIAVGGFTISSPPAAAGTLQTGIMSLPHPAMSAGACTACHQTSGGGKNATGYDHASPLIALKCNACHEAGSNLVGTGWNGATSAAAGAGDTRPFTLTSLVASYGSGLTVTYAKHFYPVDCGQCHRVPAGTAAVSSGAAYATAWDFPHDQSLMTNPSTCVMCHVGGIPGAPDGGVSDPGSDVTVTALVPRFSGTTIASVAPQTQTLPMTMVHTSTEYAAAANSACSNCHAGATQSLYRPGYLHASLVDLALPQPTACGSCHATAEPEGFVGPVQGTRSPASGSMRHEAVRWLGGAPTTTRLVPGNCGLCHASPSATVAATWATAKSGSGPVGYHASLTAGAVAQPNSCLDCHASSRAAGVLTAANATLPPNVTFDHGDPAALGDCQSCHTSTSVWSGGRFHLAGAASPATCLPCHAGERPANTTGWQSTTYTQSPFDYGTNVNGVTHGAGLDCAGCHAGPGTGAWGSTQNWQAGRFTHGAGTASATTCLTCHTSQRPDRVLGVAAARTALGGFDHAVNGTGECLGCHGATVAAGTYVRYFNAATGMLPNGDWKGGVSYPGSTLVSSTTQSITVTETSLNRTGALVTGTSASSATHYNAMLHVATVLPAALNAGPTASPDATKCWHCHTHTGTTVTRFADGQYHASLTAYAATPGGAAAPFPQPTSGCAECHASMLPSNIVMKSASVLQPMDHAAQFLSAVNLGGASVTSVDQADCSVCHRAPGTSWADGLFHQNIGAGVPRDCVQCHYPLMADAAKSDVTRARDFVMKHRSGQLTSQACATCHTGALAASAGASHAATLWQTGAFHSSVGAQPGACVDCHALSEPDAGVSTQSTVTYTFARGGTASNGAQWNNHGSSWVAGKDCAVCHAADARSSGSAWSKSTPFHPRVTTASTCTECHGTANGRGAVLGTNNNLPSGLTDSTMVSSAAGDPTTGVPAGTRAQLTHADVNVTGRDCGFCHTQKGVAAGPPAQGKEWAQASFHSHFTGATALVMNNTTGRCSNCHLNVKPGSSFPTDHSGFTAVSGSTDCSSCHSFPGTGTAAAPNWLGASGGYPQYLSVGGFTVSQPPAANATTTQAGITNLPHPTPGTTACTVCHAQAGGGKNARGYDHAATTLLDRKCDACHEAGSNLLSVGWNGSTTQAGGAGNTRPFTIAGLKPSFKGNNRTLTQGYNHFYAADCGQCHATPTGIAVPTTGTTYTTRWKFVHNESRMRTPVNTCNWCHGSPNNIPD
ncbi:MAG: hypothetical protein IPJ65_03855 [Archangiaceae bacterium]|nr:hypothetical protein [Archangiaceae bacterium]